MKIIFIIFLFSITKINANNACNMGSNFVEPRQKTFIYKKLFPYSATTNDLRKLIANDNNCTEKDITFLKITDYKEGGEYEVCVNGASMLYKRLNFTFKKNADKLINKYQLTNCSLSGKYETHKFRGKLLIFFKLFIFLILYATCAYYLTLFIKFTTEKLKEQLKKI